MEALARLLIGLGAVLVLVGALIWIGLRVGLPLGRLPGDILVQRDGFTFFFPIVSMIALSVLLTLVLTLWRLIAR